MYVFSSLLEKKVPLGYIGCDYYVVTHIIIFSHLKVSKTAFFPYNTGPTDRRTDRQTQSPIEMRSRILKGSLFHTCAVAVWNPSLGYQILVGGMR